MKWDARQLFGCHRERPWISNWWGAIWLIAGGKILAISQDIISVETIRGVRQTIRKMDHPYDFIATAWELF